MAGRVLTRRRLRRRNARHEGDHDSGRAGAKRATPRLLASLAAFRPTPPARRPAGEHPPDQSPPARSAPLWPVTRTSGRGWRHCSGGRSKTAAAGSSSSASCEPTALLVCRQRGPTSERRARPSSVARSPVSAASCRAGQLAREGTSDVMAVARWLACSTKVRPSPAPASLSPTTTYDDDEPDLPLLLLFLDRSQQGRHRPLQHPPLAPSLCSLGRPAHGRRPSSRGLLDRGRRRRRGRARRLDLQQGRPRSAAPLAGRSGPRARTRRQRCPSTGRRRRLRP